MQQANFIIFIQNDRYRFVRFFKIAFLLVNASAFAYIGITTGRYSSLVWSFFTVISVINNLSAKKIAEQFPRLQFLLLGSYWPVAGWLLLGYYWVSIPVCIVTILNSFIKKIFRFSFFADAVRIDSFPARTMQWAHLQNLVLKDGLLTIDFKNNHIIQSEILLLRPETKSEADFNEFCQSQLIAAR